MKRLEDPLALQRWDTRSAIGHDDRRAVAVLAADDMKPLTGGGVLLNVAQ